MLFSMVVLKLLVILNVVVFRSRFLKVCSGPTSEHVSLENPESSGGVGGRLSQARCRPSPGTQERQVCRCRCT